MREGESETEIVKGAKSSLELFAGAGGSALGVERAGFEHVAVIERDPLACETLSANTDWPVIRHDVTEFDYSPFRDKVDLLSGGPPCQPFSLGGNHGAFRDSRDMFPEAIRAVREIRPKFFMFENVKGFARRRFADYLEYVKLQLKYPEIIPRENESHADHRGRLERYQKRGAKDGLRYEVKLAVLDAANYGIPQRRQRVFIVGCRGDLDIAWDFPPATHSRDALIWSQYVTGEYWERHSVPREERSIDPSIKRRAASMEEPPSTFPWKTVRDALVDLPDPVLEPKAAKAFDHHEFHPGARAYPGHTGSVLDAPAKTLKAGVNGVPGGENMLRHPEYGVRYFTIRECARLQGFPDDYSFRGPWSRMMRQLGNAIPTGLAKVVAKSILDILYA